ncbi:MAG: hypothetical protein NVSMB47_03700 [Polyangiales bacterium]
MTVYVLHPDLDVLAALVGKLRDRGMETVHATEATALVARIAKAPPAVLVVPEPAPSAEVAAQIAVLRAAMPPVRLVAVPPGIGPLDPALSAVVDEITTVLANAPPGEVPSAPGAGEVRGDLAQIPLPDLLQLLSMGKKTGTLSVTTSSAAGELRLADGEVVDAMVRRAEGMKAVIRLLGEREGAFHFAPSSSPGLRRIREPISAILMEGTRQTDEIRRLREQLGLVAPNQVLALHVVDALFAPEGPLDPEDVVAGEVTRALATPRTLDDLLDELPRHDLEILGGLARLAAAGILRRLPLGELRPSLAGPEGMVVLRGLAKRLRPRGYRGHGRLVLTGSAATVRLARQAIARLAEAMPGPDSGAELSSDRAIEATTTLQLGESIGLDVMTVIDRDDVTPALPMILNGAVGVITLDRPSPALAQMVEELEVALVDARSVSDELPDGPIDAGDPATLAAVVRGAMEGMGGT